jgi:UDP-N-acetylmuramoyl-L-alanyl-D-glutamate--2,6-diaminopimelate ligase
VVIVDYSHTADAFERVLTTCRELGPERVTVVFGCGGDRDRSKRPLIGAVAERLADRCIITTDNPRTEAVEDIVAGIRSGMSGAGDVTVELDRAAAIAAAIAAAGPRDLVAVLGKGHEQYQIIGDTRTPWSDRKEAERALENWGKQ